MLLLLTRSWIFRRALFIRQVVGVLLLTSCSVLPTGSAAAQQQDKPAPPTAVVSFDHTLLRQNDSANVDIWFVNPSERDTNVVLTIAGTNYLRWQDGSCGSLTKEQAAKESNPPATSEQDMPNPLTLGTVLAGSTIRRTLCAKAGSVLYAGDYNLLFTFEYHAASSRSAGGLVAIEKPVRLAFLGTDNIAGIPLAFSCFILPGFFFWLIAELVGGFKAMGDALGEKTIYSIMISFAIVAISSPGASFSLALGVSIRKLVFLSSIGAGAGLLVGLIFRGVKLYRARQQNRWKIDFNEDPSLVLQKLLHKYPDRNRTKVTISLKDGSQYIGSLYDKNETDTGLVGWFQLQVSSNNSKIDKLKTRQKWAEIADWARAQKTQLIQHRPIRAKTSAMPMEHDTEMQFVLSWKNDQVAGVNIEFEQTSGALEVIKGASP